MSRKLIWTLILIAVVVIVLLLNASARVSLDFHWTSVSVRAPFAYLGFTAAGVLIGALLK